MRPRRAWREVIWRKTALDARAGLLEFALRRAIERPDPQIYRAALADDDEIERSGEQLDGVATWRAGVVPNTFLRVVCAGRLLIVYRRRGDAVDILDVVPSRRHWRDMPA